MTELAGSLGWAALAFALAYAIGSIPFAYLIVRWVTGEDITQHGSGNIGAMNVRRTTGSWGWFVLAMLADGMKGLIPVFAGKTLGFTVLGAMFIPVAGMRDSALASTLAMSALAGSVFGHNYSVWIALARRRYARTGKGLATGGGALLAYDWRYFVAVVVVGLLTIAVTRYFMAGQVAAAATLPVVAFATRSSDAWFVSAVALVVYVAHHKRFVGLLRGEEPRLYFRDRMGPQG